MATNNYSITFRSLRGNTLYIVTIGGGSGEAIPLKGGAQPFTTEEDNSEDEFEPIRTSTGYIRIVDDGCDANGNAWDWHDLIPETDTSRPVTLKDGNATTLWQGFLQAQNFGSVLYGNPQEREFPVQCCISAMNSVQVRTSVSAINNFAWFLYDMFVTKMGTYQFASFSEFVVQGGNDAQNWLLMKFDWQNLLRESEDSDIEPAYTYKEAMEEICKFWGWTLRTKGSSVYLTAMDDSVEQTLLVMTAAQLQSMANGTYAGTVTSVSSPIAYSGDIFASIDNDDMLDRGPNKITVNASANDHETIIKCFPASIENTMEDLTWTWHTNDPDTRIGYFESAPQTTIDSPILHGDGVATYGTFSKRQIFTSNEEEDASISDMLVVNHAYNGSAWIQLRTKYPMCFANGSFKLSGTVYFDDHVCNWPDGAHVIMRLGVGMTRGTARWWHLKGVQSSSAYQLNYGWTAQGTVDEFDAYVKGGSIAGPGVYVADAIPVPVSFPLIPTVINGQSQNMFGYLFVDILGFHSVAGESQESFQIENFRVTFTREDIIIPTSVAAPFRPRKKKKERESSRKYTVSNPGSADNKYDVNTIFCSDKRMNYGTGQIYYPTCIPVEKAPYNNTQTTQHPEQHLANRIAAYWAQSKRRMKVELRTNLLTGNMPEATPANKVTMDGTTFHPISFNHDWYNDITTMYLLQV